jgi:EAL domain-containing protein (putative c-di-GMP-specific phosphodiesterase class I)
LAAVRPKIARIGFPYLTNPLRIDVGHSVALNNPLLNPKRVLDRAFHQAVERAVHQRRADDFSLLESLQETISGNRVVTAYQSIVRIKDRTVLGFEALTRGAVGTGMETADVLFGAARDHQLLVELDRLCRTRALESARRIPKQAKIFVNTLPATIRDPEFRGKPLIEFLDRVGISPDRIVIEITEKLVIENYNLFAETLAYFTELGMRFAVDDVGAGYSGLEAVARLRPSYLKIDMGLVRELHTSKTNQEMIKAILAMGRGIEATVIAEGIQTESEAQTLESLGIEYGQGFYFSRPLLVGEWEE